MDEYLVRDFDYVELDRQSDVKGLYNEQIYRQTIDAITGDLGMQDYVMPIEQYDQKTNFGTYLRSC